MARKASQNSQIVIVLPIQSNTNVIVNAAKQE